MEKIEERMKITVERRHKNENDQSKGSQGDILAESASISQLQNQHNRDQQYGRGGVDGGGAAFKSDSTGYIEDICPYATFQLSKSPASISSPYEESTYSGNVYSGPYHSVRGTFVYHQPKTPTIDYKRHLREPEYTKVRRQGGKLREPHSESQEYDDLGSEDSADGEGGGRGRSQGKSKTGGEMMRGGANTHQHQEMVSFRHRMPSREVSKESSTSSEDSLTGGGAANSVCGRKPLPPPSRKSKVKQMGLVGKRGVKSSSGYSSHTEETTFSFSDRMIHPPPPSRFSDRSSISRDLSDSSDLTKRRSSRSSNRPAAQRDNTFQIDV